MGVRLVSSVQCPVSSVQCGVTERFLFQRLAISFIATADKKHSYPKVCFVCLFVHFLLQVLIPWDNHRSLPPAPCYCLVLAAMQLPQLEIHFIRTHQSPASCLKPTHQPPNILSLSRVLIVTFFHSVIIAKHHLYHFCLFTIWPKAILTDSGSVLCAGSWKSWRPTGSCLDT